MEGMVMNVCLAVGLLVVVAYLVITHIKAKKNNGTVLANGVRVIEKPMGVTSEELAIVVKNLQTSFNNHASIRDNTIEQQGQMINRLEHKLNLMDIELREVRFELHEARAEIQDLKQKVGVMDQLIRGYEKTHIHRVK